jgi:hypothetical protein
MKTFLSHFKESTINILFDIAIMKISILLTNNNMINYNKKILINA